ncbi:hypothetical protein [Deinococcus aluminii]|uniref:Uncharacterized protein n=1 Tax=Deinococcus aluminii TaxID=1656885 RepID=A0ABP9XG00_9DEIO
MPTYRKYNVSTHQNGISQGQIVHTQAEMLALVRQVTATGGEITVKEVWLEDQGAGPCEGAPREESASG